MVKRNGADLLVDTLEQLGVDILFGIPGIHNLDIYDSLLNSKIKHITAKHEQGAGYMADGYSRVTDKPGVCLVITGPGLTNIITPMGQAFGDSIPMIVISSQMPTSFIGQRTGFLHELNNPTYLTKSVTKESRTITQKEHIGHYLEEAYHLAVSGRPGPVHLEIPMDILQDTVESVPQLFFKNPAYYQNWNIEQQEEQILKSVKLLNKADQTVIITGGGSIAAADKVMQLSEKLGAPIVQTVAGKGSVSEKYPLCLGTRSHLPAVIEIVQRADAVVAVGTELAPTDLWEVPLALDGKLIQIDMDPANFNRNYRTDIPIRGDAAMVLDKIVSNLDEKDFDADARHKQVADAKVQGRCQLKSVTGINDQMDYILEMLAAIREGTPEDAVVLADMTTPAYVALSEFPSYHPNTFLHPVGFGTLGWALPAAIGVKLADTHNKALVLVGDGGFQFTLQELAVIAEHNIALPIIIWNDSCFGEIKRNEKARHPGETIAVDHKNPDFIRIFASYGISGQRVTTAQELKQALKEAFSKENPMLIEVDVAGGLS